MRTTEAWELQYLALNIFKNPKEIMTKKCYKCKIEKDISNFHKKTQNKDGHSGICKECKKIEDKKYRKENFQKLSEKGKERGRKWRKTLIGKLKSIYSGQIASSKHRKMDMPKYSQDEFIDYALNKTNYKILFNKWKESNFDNKLAPSFDRINDYEGYSFENIQLTTWNENKKKGDLYRKIGLNNKSNKEVIQYDLKGNLINRFHSGMEAYRKTGILHIHSTCRGERKTAGGYVWKYS